MRLVGDRPWLQRVEDGERYEFNASSAERNSSAKRFQSSETAK